MNKIWIGICFWISSLAYSVVYGQGVLDYVNPFVGTAPTLQKSSWEGHGRTYPGAVAPFGYIQCSPETRVSPGGSGYDYRDSRIYFFSSMEHFSGYPEGSSGTCIILPVENSKEFRLRKDSRPFSHKDEVAEPGYYKVKFGDNGTTVETTASTRAGMFRFTYQHNVKPRLFIGEIGEIKFDTCSVIYGSNRNVVIEFSANWSKVERTGDGVVLTFDKQPGNQLLLKISSSSVSTGNALNNLHAEMPDWNFEQVKRNSQNEWEKQLSVITITDSSVQNKTKFYTALYHAQLLPWIISDVDEQYQGKDKKIHRTNGKNQYGGFSPWDTFRSLHPLFCIIAPERQNDMVLSMLDQYKQTGQLPWQPMTGFHSIPVIVDTYFKNITGFDKIMAYEAMKKCLLDTGGFYDDFPAYAEKGYVPASYKESVTRTVEYAYDDWVLSRFATEAMGNQKDHAFFGQRSLNYRNLFDPVQMFLVPRNEDTFTISNSNFGYKEGDKWIYSLFVPHNVRDLINLMGGNDEFARHLEQAVREEYILFDNEPGFHIPYLFNYALHASKTQEWIYSIREKLFTANADGLPGNDDLGSLSSWFVFNTLGFFPVCPGIPEYNIGVPLFAKTEIYLPNGKSFVIHAPGISEQNRYIQSASLNDKAFNSSWFNHDVLMTGGEMTFTMGSVPSGWTSQNQPAFSLTTGQSEFSLDKISSGKTIVESNELFNIKFTLRNRGSSGVKKVLVLVDNEETACKNVYAGTGKTVTDSIGLRLYKPGKHTVSVENQKIFIEVRTPEKPVEEFECSGLSFKALVKAGESQQVCFWVKNIGGLEKISDVELHINNVFYKSMSVKLDPGEKKQVFFEVQGLKKGMNRIRAGKAEGSFKVFEEHTDATLADLKFQNKSGLIIADVSGFSNHGLIRTSRIQEDSAAFNNTFFVEIENNMVFATVKKNLSVLAWIKPDISKQRQMSVITQGDHNVVQLNGNRQIEFFAGGWGRGSCMVELDTGFFAQWHHIACIAEGQELRLYIDGELKGRVETNNIAEMGSNENWSIGRNAEFPGERIYFGRIDEIKIYDLPLKQKEIIEIIENEKLEFRD